MKLQIRKRRKGETAEEAALRAEAESAEIDSQCDAAAMVADTSNMNVKDATLRARVAMLPGMERGDDIGTLRDAAVASGHDPDVVDAVLAGEAARAGAGDYQAVVDAVVKKASRGRAAAAEALTISGVSKAVFREYVNKFREMTLDESATVTNAQRQLHSVGGIEAVVRACIGEPWVVSEIVESAELHEEKTGAWPGQLGGEILYGPCKGRKWKNADEYLKHNHGTSLHQLNPNRTERFGDPWVVPEIVESAEIHLATKGRWPSNESGEILYGPCKGRTWNAANGWLRKRHGTSLAELNPNPTRGVWTRADIASTIVSHHASTGKWPSKKSGEILYGPYAGTGKLWDTLDSWLSHPARGEAKTTLAALCKELAKREGK